MEKRQQKSVVKDTNDDDEREDTSRKAQSEIDEQRVER